MTQPKSVSRTWPWILLAALWVVALLNYLDRQVIFSIFPLLQRDLHASSVELGLTSTVFLFTYGALSPFAGYVADRFGRGRTILGSLVVWSIACAIASSVHTIGGMLWSRAGMGISEAFYIPAALALIVETHGERSKSLATGIHQSGCYTGIILGGSIGGLVGEKFGWRPLFAALGLIGVVYAVFLAFILRKQPIKHEPAANKTVQWRSLLRGPALKIFTGVFVAASIANWILYTWLPLYLYDHFHLSLARAGFEATFWLQSASYAGAFLGGFLSDRSPQGGARRRLVVQAIGMALAFPFLLFVGHAGSEILVVLALVAVGFGRGCFDANTAPVLAVFTGPELCATAYGVLNCGGCIVGGLGALAGGWLRQRMDFSYIFDVAGVSLLLGTLGLLLLIGMARPAATGGQEGKAPA